MKFRSAVNGRGAAGRWAVVVGLGLVVAGLAGCAWPHREPGAFTRPFTMGRDNFSYSNELFWTYQMDPQTGRTYHHWRKPSPDYAQHCYVVSRSARQFFQFARFDPSLPATDEATYRELIRRVVRANPRHEFTATNRVVFPGFASLYEFSGVYEDLLKAECGTMWQSYFQRGNWRMILPFSKRHQRRTASALVESIEKHRPPIVHVAHFPRLQINHALVLYAVEKTAEGLDFTAYDPNFANTPAHLYFRESTGRFFFPRQPYFPGAVVDVYEIYHRWCY